MALSTNVSFILIFLFLREVTGTLRIDPLVETKVGLVRGLRASDGAYSMFLGIPYATVDPENPFSASKPYPEFSDVFEAYDDTAICPQIEEFENNIVGNLDCLQLNIYVPNSASSRNRLPVLVYIYGGGFNIGFSGRFLYGPKYLVRHDVLLVTFNYRLGPYGFMCLDTPEIPGNQGLKDQLTALKWINDNIEAFGGDINKITIFGESAGSASVDLQFLYASGKLFQNVILQSGTSLCPWIISESDKEAPIKLAEQLGYSTNIPDDALRFLATVDTNLVIAATDELQLSFGPCIEKVFEGVENLIIDYPNNIELGNLNNIPFIIGFNNDEMHANFVDSDDNTNIFNEYLLETFDFEDEYLIEMERYVRHFYIGDEEINEKVKTNLATPAAEFSDVFEAYDDSAICPQLEELTNTIAGSLDCLHLNIYVPDVASSNNRLPVLVWLYGGGFNRGFAGKYIYGPKYLVNHNIILVTLNYRLGPYGFMCLNTPEVPGNQGLKDQLIALKWLNNNIDAFGGDINRITLFGESAGGASVDYHLLYNREKLFNNVILQSGTSFCPWALTRSNTDSLFKLAEYLGFETNITNEALQFLAKIDTNLVIASMIDLDLTPTFKPCVETDYDNTDNFITEHPINVKIENFKNIPVLIGYNNDEMLYQYGIKEPSFFNNTNVFEELLNIPFSFESSYYKEMEEISRHFYLGDEVFSDTVQDSIRNFASDFRFVHPSERTVQNYMNNGITKIFLYLFSYTGERNYAKKIFNITTGNAAHSDEIGYLFDVSFFKDNPSLEDRTVIDRITTLWANFAKYGDPTPEITDLLPVKWPIITKDMRPYLNIDKDIKVEHRNFNDRMAFWDLFYKLNKNFQMDYTENEDL
ncbi:esterase E4-like [Achroia grisella]|uniref:esterase E4-like n=1 Tax=Achroia grisella TaxID=688607 RepID=UPI0027D2F5D0|nr:esterase E4-like [Achroia grisella]